MKTTILEEVKESLAHKKELVSSIKMYLLNPKGKTILETDQFNQYMDGLFIKDITTLEQSALGITILHVVSQKQTDFDMHVHENQSQTISVKKGRVYNLKTNEMFEAGESFFVPRNKKHSTRYDPNTESLITYMPSLTEVIH